MNDIDKKFLIKIRRHCRDYLNNITSLDDFQGSMGLDFSNWEYELSNEIHNLGTNLMGDVEIDRHMYYGEKKFLKIKKSVVGALHVINAHLSELEKQVQLLHKKNKK